jgi:DNA-binding LytR/AlgR family response regulator
VPVDPAEIYLLETAEGDTSVRPRSRRQLRDVRRLGDLVELLAPHGFVQIHRSYAVNLRRVREIRPVDGGGLGGADGPAGQPGAAGEPA